MVTLLEIKRDGSHFTARCGSHTSAKRLAVRLLRVIVTLPERLVKSFYPTIPTSHAERAAATKLRSPAGPRRLRNSDTHERVAVPKAFYVLQERI